MLDPSLIFMQFTGCDRKLSDLIDHEVQLTSGDNDNEMSKGLSTRFDLSYTIVILTYENRC